VSEVAALAAIVERGGRGSGARAGGQGLRVKVAAAATGPYAAAV